jgi:hypothetical protein
MAAPARYVLCAVPVRIWWRRGCLERFVTEQPPYSILVRGIEEDVLPTTQHDTVLIGSPIWNVRTPMIMSTFATRAAAKQQQCGFSPELSSAKSR